LVSWNIQQDLLDQIKGLEKRVKTLERSQRVTSVVQSTGVYTFYASDGITPLFAVGDQPFGDRGVVMNRDDGSQAFRLNRPFAPDTFQLLQMYDRNGAAIFQEEYLHGEGMDMPKQATPFWHPVNASLDVGTNSTTFVDLFRCRAVKQNWYLHTAFEVVSSIGTVQGQFQYRDSFFGAFGAVVSHTAGTTRTEYTLEEAAVPFGEVGNERDVFLTGRVSSGTGTVTVRIVQTRGQ
jgi:hypothetical protein